MINTINRATKSGPDPLGLFGSGLSEKLKTWGISAQSAMLVKALHELLDGQDEASRQLRMDVQIHLARASNSDARQTKQVAQPAKEMLSTEAAAILMGCSRPYVAMLIDAEQLEGAVKSRGGHRKVPKTSVLKWINDHRQGKDADSNYRRAAKEAGMYDISDEEYIETVNRNRESDD